MNRSKILGLFLCLALSLALMPPASAQTLGSIEGYVTDDTGAALPGVSVDAKNTETGGRRSAISNAAGFYNLDALVAGIYDVTAMLDGFQTVVREGVKVQVAQTVTISLELPVGSVEEAITVTGESPGDRGLALQRRLLHHRAGGPGAAHRGPRLHRPRAAHPDGAA